MNIDIKNAQGDGAPPKKTGQNPGAPADNSDDSFDLVKAMEGQPILVIGDIMLDRFCYGAVERISPESPVPVLQVKKEHCMLGGAGNALANLVGLKTTPHVIAVIGDDAEGDKIKTMAEEQGIDAGGLLRISARPSTVKTRFLSGHQQLLRTDYEDNTVIGQNDINTVLASAQDKIPHMKAVILSDYGKGLLSEDLIKGIIETARQHGVPVVVDPKGKDFSIYRGASAVTPNKKELSEATQGAAVASNADIEAAAGRIIEQCGIEAVVATRSADGISVIGKDSPPFHMPTRDIEVYDVSGAGDTVIATIASALAAGSSLTQAAALANVAGSIVVTKVGTAPIRAEELLDMLAESDEYGGSISPVMDWNGAGEQIRRWQARGLKVGFTNGCFDILHAGHVAYLAEAKANCDRLIVGLNHDASVRILKGPERPIHDQDARAQVMAGLQAVDLVVFFGAEQAGEDNTPCAIVDALRPDIFFKGGDYTIEDLPEAKVVQAYGGEVSIMCEKEGFSTTNAIKKIRSSAA